MWLRPDASSIPILSGYPTTRAIASTTNLVRASGRGTMASSPFPGSSSLAMMRSTTLEAIREAVSSSLSQMCLSTSQWPQTSNGPPSVSTPLPEGLWPTDIESLNSPMGDCIPCQWSKSARRISDELLQSLHTRDYISDLKEECTTRLRRWGCLQWLSLGASCRHRLRATTSITTSPSARPVVHGYLAHIATMPCA